MRMLKNSAILPIFAATALLSVSPIVFADSYSEWSQLYSGVQYQYVNQFGGNDWDGMRWHNSNAQRVAIHYKMKLMNGKISKQLIYLEGDATSKISAIAEGERVEAITVTAP